MYDDSGYVGDAIMGTNWRGEPELIGFTPAPPFYFQAIVDSLRELLKAFGQDAKVFYDREYDSVQINWRNESYSMELSLSDSPEVRVEEQIDESLNQTFLFRAFNLWEYGSLGEREVSKGKAWDSTCATIADKLSKMLVYETLEAINPQPVEIGE